MNWFILFLVNGATQRLIHCIMTVGFILSLDSEMEAMVSHLVAEDEGNRKLEEEIVSGSKGPDVSERVQMAMETSRPATAQMVLSQEALFLPDDHPLL